MEMPCFFHSLGSNSLASFLPEAVYKSQRYNFDHEEKFTHNNSFHSALTLIDISPSALTSEHDFSELTDILEIASLIDVECDI